MVSPADFQPNHLYGTVQYGNFIEFEDAKEFLQIPDVDTSRDAVLQRCINAVCSHCARHINGPIGRTLYEPPTWGVFNGGWGNTNSYIYLPKQPVLQVVQVIEYQGSASVVLNELNPSSGGDGYRVNYVDGYVERITGGIYQRPWYPGEMSVWITWWAGFEPVPPEIWFEAMQWVKRKFDSTQIGLAGKGSAFDSGGASEDHSSAMPGSMKGALESFVMPGIA